VWSHAGKGLVHHVFEQFKVLKYYEKVWSELTSAEVVLVVLVIASAIAHVCVCRLI
jgi:hypothetical protein